MLVIVWLARREKPTIVDPFVIRASSTLESRLVPKYLIWEVIWTFVILFWRL